MVRLVIEALVSLELRDPSELPGRWQSWVFQLKATVLQVRRSFNEWGSRPPKHSRSEKGVDEPVIGRARAKLWTQVSEAEFPLTAGKVENLRVAAAALHGLVIPADEVFSFWRQLGRTTRGKGYNVGRELREGCLVPNRGGGLCQVTGLLYQAALEAGLDVVERHAHSRLVPGSMGEEDLDATVFWNYVDLRFRAPFDWRLEVELDATEMTVRIRGKQAGDRPIEKKEPAPVSREAPSGDCLTCGQTACFRHPAAVSDHAPNQGHSAFVLDCYWPEFDKWCRGHARDNDRWFVPFDGERFGKANYAWRIPKGAEVTRAVILTLSESLRQRGLPAQGAIRQKTLLKRSGDLARFFAAKLSPECRHLVVSQNLLPHLWQMGVLGGRTFDVLMERWPLGELQSRLDQAAERHPKSPTLADFRADPVLLRMERKALDRAGKLITPHRAIAAHFGHRAWLLDWDFPKAGPRSPSPGDHFFLPCSPLGRKGIYDLRAFGKRLVVLGKAREGNLPNFFRQGTMEDLVTAKAVVLPAWIEHQPRIALQALANGIPVYATEECGLPEHECLTVLERHQFADLLDDEVSANSRDEKLAVEM